MLLTVHVLLLLTVGNTPAQSGGIYKNVGCEPDVCSPGNYSSTSELKLVTSVILTARTVFMEDYTVAVGVTVDTSKTRSYLNHTVTSTEPSNTHFHSDSGLWIINTPALGNGIISNIFVNVSHVGVMRVYSLGMYEECDRYNNFWKCLNNSDLLYEEWGEGVNSALDDLEYFSLSFLEETFYVVNSVELSVSSVGDQDAAVDFMIQMGHYLGFESVNATVFCNTVKPGVTIGYADYETPVKLDLVPFFTLQLQYKTYQPYELQFEGLTNKIASNKLLDVLAISTLNITDGTLSFERPLTGYFSSYSITFQIPLWETLYENHDNVSFNLQSIVDGYYINMPATSQSLYEIIHIVPPSKIEGPENVTIVYPDTTIAAQIEDSTLQQALFTDSIVKYNWSLSVMPSNIVISRSTKRDFLYDDLIMPAHYALNVEIETQYDVTFTLTQNIEFVSEAFTLINCFLNCDPAFTTRYVKLHLSVDIGFKFGVASALWSVVEIDTNAIITENVTLFDNLVELSVDTSVLTKKNYVVNMVMVTLENNITIPDSYHFNMSYPVYTLDCTVSPHDGMSLVTKHSISCVPRIDNIYCDICQNEEDELCALCLKEYVYYFKLCQDHGTCAILTPLVMGNLSQPNADNLTLPVGEASDSYITTIVVCMYDGEFDNVEYVHKLVPVTSRPDPDFDISVFLGLPTLYIDEEDKEQTFGTLLLIGAALSVPGDFNETVQQQIVEILQKVPGDDYDVSMQKFSILYPMSRLSLSKEITKDLNSITNITYQSLQSASKEVVETASGSMMSVMWNVVQSNVKIADVQVDLPELDFYFVTQSPDEDYYNKWVNFDYDVESKVGDDTARSDEICATLQTLQDYASQSLGKGIALGETSSLSLPNIEYSLGRITASILSSGNQLVGKEFVNVPPAQFKDVSFTDTMSISFIKFKSNPCILTHNSERIKSAVIGVNITDPSQKQITIERFERPIEVLIPLNNIKPMNEFIYNPDNGYSYFQLDVFVKHHSAVFLQLMSTRATTVLIKSLTLPKTLEYDFKYELPNVNMTKKKEAKLVELGFSSRQGPAPFVVQVPFTNGTHYIGIEVASSKPRRFWLMSYTTSCLEWTGSGWSVNSSNIGILSNVSVTHCMYDTMSLYAADLSFPPLTEYKLPLPNKGIMKQFLNSLFIWIPLIVIYGYFLSTFTLVLRLDDRDTRSWNLLHMLSSRKTQHSYKIVIRTGLRIKAGTTSQVCLEIHGSKGTRKVNIKQKEGDLFGTNQTSSFLYYSDIDVGKIDKIFAWIDYSGSSPDWFLESVKITDKREIFMFIYNNWIGYDIERYGCSIPRYHPSRTSFFKRLLMLMSECLVNHHSGLSYLFKGTRCYPPRRYLATLFILRCLTILSLVAGSVANTGETLLTSGILSKLVSLLLTTLPVFYLLEKCVEKLMKNQRHNFLLRQMLTRHDSETSVRTCDTEKYFWVTAADKVKPSVSDAGGDSLDEYFGLVNEGERMRRYDKPDTEPLVKHLADDTRFVNSIKCGELDKDCGEQDKLNDYFKLFWDDASSNSSNSLLSLLSFEKYIPLTALPTINYRYSSSFLVKTIQILPYFGCGIATLVYIFFVYTNKSLHIHSCLLYFCVAVIVYLFLEQPLVCGVVSLVNSYKVWYVKQDPDLHCDVVLNCGEAAEKVTKDNALPSTKMWTQVMNTRHRMNSVIVKLFSYIAFIVVVVVLSKQDRQTKCYYLNTSVRKVFATPSFDAIETRDDFWNWVQNEYSSALSSADFFKDTRVTAPKEAYLRDSSTIIISISRMRQIRITPSECPDSTTNSDTTVQCNHGYSSALTDKDSHNPGWTTHTAASSAAPFSTVRYKSYWEYQEEENGVSVAGLAGRYPGGGYIVPLANSPTNARKQLGRLQQDGWVDELTRVVFIELSVYNPPTGFLCTVKLVVEFLPTGNVVSSAKLHSINFMQYSRPITINNTRTVLVYVTCLLFLTLHHVFQSYTAHTRGHSVWRGFWTVLDCCTLLAGWTSVYMYIFRYKYVREAITAFVATPLYYIDFHQAAQVDIYFGYCLGALVFLVTVKVVDLVVVHVKVKLMTLIIHNSMIELSSFGIPFFVILTMFSQTFYCLYSPSMAEYSTMPSSAGQTFAFILGEYNWEGMMRARPYLTPFLGIVLGVLSIMYLSNMFAVIVCYNTSSARITPPNSSNHLAIFGYIQKNVREIVFLIMPILADVYSVLKRSFFAQNKGYKNPYYVVPSESASLITEDQSITVKPEKIEKISVQNIAVELEPEQLDNIQRMKRKLKHQAQALKKLNKLLSSLESRIVRFSNYKGA